MTAAESPEKAAALVALHASRRGARVHPAPPAALAAIHRAWQRGLQDHGPMLNPCALAPIARELEVDPRTLRRWLSGEDRPAAQYHPALRRVARRLK